MYDPSEDGMTSNRSPKNRLQVDNSLMNSNSLQSSFKGTNNFESNNVEEDNMIKENRKLRKKLKELSAKLDEQIEKAVENKLKHKNAVQSTSTAESQNL